jgi:protein-S-isoprenylcysteine O-methyltransferase Ste14
MTAKNGEATSSVLVKSLVLASLVIVSVFVAVPLGLLTVADGWLTFHVGDWRFAGLAPIVVGTGFAFWTVVYFALVGKGTPAPFDPPKRFVTGGLFGYVRNPMYLGAVVVLFSEALLLESFVVFFFAAFMWFFFHLFVVYYEEPRLREKFGEAYAAYVRRVPRWLPRRRGK